MRWPLSTMRGVCPHAHRDNTNHGEGHRRRLAQPREEWNCSVSGHHTPGRRLLSCSQTWVLKGKLLRQHPGSIPRGSVRGQKKSCYTSIQQTRHLEKDRGDKEQESQRGQGLTEPH